MIRKLCVLIRKLCVRTCVRNLCVHKRACVRKLCVRMRTHTQSLRMSTQSLRSHTQALLAHASKCVRTCVRKRYFRIEPGSSPSHPKCQNPMVDNHQGGMDHSNVKTLSAKATILSTKRAAFFEEK